MLLINCSKFSSLFCTFARWFLVVPVTTKKYECQTFQLSVVLYFYPPTKIKVMSVMTMHVISCVHYTVYVCVTCERCGHATKFRGPKYLSRCRRTTQVWTTGCSFFFLFCPPEYSFWSGCHVAVVRSGGTWQKLESHLDIVYCKHPIYSKKLGMDYCQVNVAVVAIFGLDSFFERIWFGFQTKQPTRSTR
jgi:hypothetical protein